MFNGDRVSVWEDEKALERMAVMVSQECERNATNRYTYKWTRWSLLRHVYFTTIQKFGKASRRLRHHARKVLKPVE